MTLEETEHVGNMNTIKTFILLFILSSLGCAQSQTKTNSNNKANEKTVKQENIDFLITDSKVGDFHRGASITELSEKYGKQLVENKTNGETYYSFVENNKELLKVFPAYDTRYETFTKFVGRITVCSDQFADKNGLKIGSTVSDFSNKYPNTYAYYDAANNRILLSNKGVGPQYVLSASNLKKGEYTNIGRIDLSEIDPNAKIIEINLIRSEQENDLADKKTEEENIIESYLQKVVGNYYLSDESEHYYKIRRMQGDYLLSECFEDDCTKRGEIVGCRLDNRGFTSLLLKNLSGESGPQWSISPLNQEKIILYVYDYDAMEDQWTNNTFTKIDLD